MKHNSDEAQLDAREAQRHATISIYIVIEVPFETTLDNVDTATTSEVPLGLS